MYRTFTLIVALLASGTLRAQTPPAQTNPDLEQRVRELEAKIQLLTGTAPTVVQPAATTNVPPDANPAPAAPAEASVSSETPSKPLAGWDNGFYIRSPDDRFKLRFTGQIQADNRSYLDTGDRTDISSYLLRRARFGLEAELFEHYEFRFLPDFAQGQARIQDSYINIHYWDSFQVLGGKFKQPFSYEQLIQDRFTPFMERSLIDQLVPARDVGVMLHGQKLFGDRFDWGLSVSNGEINGDGDTNNMKDYAFRVAVRPFKGLDAPLIDSVQLGFAYTTGIEQEASTFTLKTPAGVQYFTFLPNVRADGLRNRWSPEFAYFYQAFGFASQYFKMDQEFRAPNGTSLVNVAAEGWYIMATLLLTGETRTTYSEPIDPLRPFDPRPGQFGPGAWELAGRVSRLQLSNNVFLPLTSRLADPTKVSNNATEMTLGFNWYLNKYVRTQFNWEHSWFDRPVQLGPAKTQFFTRNDALMTRLQIIF